MNPSSIFAAPEALHPSLWRASQLAHADTRCIDTGHATLSGQLPGGGWPGGTLVDLLLTSKFLMSRPTSQVMVKRTDYLM